MPGLTSFSSRSRRPRPRVLFLLLVALLAAGCVASTGIRRGLEYQDRGEYIEAYHHFKKLADARPGNSEVAVYARTARGLAFRQCLDFAGQALASDDLDGFVKYMKQANDIRPKQAVRNVIEVAEEGKRQGKSDIVIRAEVRAAMGLEAGEGTLGEALAGTATRIAEKVRAGEIRDPVSVQNVTVGESGETGSASTYFENELSAEMIGKGIRIVERENLEKIKKEIQMSATSLMDEGQAIEIGKIAGARSMLTGTIFRLKDTAKYQIRVIDIETSGVVFQETETFYPDAGFDQMLKEGL